jgi:putative molybdopterin biosynthesis protein
VAQCEGRTNAKDLELVDGPYEDVLTADDVAVILQVNKNTVYGLAKAGTLPSYNVGRKLRFSLDDVRAYIEAAKGERRRAGSATSGAPPVAGPALQAAAAHRADAAAPLAQGAFVIGGRDLLLDILANYLSTVGIRVLRSYENGYRELVSLYEGRVQAAAVHLWDSSSDTYNLPYVKRLVPGTPVVVLHLATRAQGLLVRRDNPLGLRGWPDLVHTPLVLANRERGSGARVLLDEKLRMLEADPFGIEGYEREIASALVQGTLIARGGADAGIGTERVFHQIEGLDYVPLQTERLALVIAKTPETRRTIRAVRGFLGSDMFRGELISLPGYDFTRLGAKLYET